MDTQEKDINELPEDQEAKGFFRGLTSFFSIHLGRRIWRAQSIVGIRTPGVKRKHALSEAAERKARRELAAKEQSDKSD